MASTWSGYLVHGFSCRVALAVDHSTCMALWVSALCFSSLDSLGSCHMHTRKRPLSPLVASCWSGLCSINSRLVRSATPWLQSCRQEDFRLRLLCWDETFSRHSYAQVMLSLLTTSSNIVGIICGVLTPYMLNPGAWNWSNYAGFFWVCSPPLTPLIRIPF